MSAEFPDTLADTAAGFVARTLPLLRALDAVLDEDAAGLTEVLAVAEAQRPGATAALAAVLAAEAGHLQALGARIEAAVARLRRIEDAARCADLPPAELADQRPSA